MIEYHSEITTEATVLPQHVLSAVEIIYNILIDIKYCIILSAECGQYYMVSKYERYFFSILRHLNVSESRA